MNHYEFFRLPRHEGPRNKINKLKKKKERKKNQKKLKQFRVNCKKKKLPCLCFKKKIHSSLGIDRNLLEAALDEWVEILASYTFLIETSF